MLFIVGFVILAFINILAIPYLYARRQAVRQAFRIPPSLSLEIEQDRAPASHEWEDEFIPIGTTTLTTEAGEIWVKHKEDVLLPGYGPDLPPWDLSRQRLFLN